MRPACTDWSATTSAQEPARRGAVGQEEYDRYEGDYREAVANLDVAKANRDLAALNLEYARVTAPVSGRVSRYVVTVGNLIQSGDQNGGTLLTTIVLAVPAKTLRLARLFPVQQKWARVALGGSPGRRW